MNITFGNPWVLLLIPIIAAILILLVRGLKVRQIKKVRKSLLLHIIVAGLLLFAVSNPTVRWVGNKVTTIYVVDLSDSTAFAAKDMEQFIYQGISQMPKNHQAGILSFGAEVRVEQFVSDKKVFSGFSGKPRGDGTNIEDGLTAALAMFPEDGAKQIVLLTDGKETDGSIESLIPSLLSNQIDVKVVEFEREDDGEVYVNYLEVPDRIHLGDQFLVKIEVMSTKATNGVIYLYSGKNLKAREEVAFVSGSNSFVFRDTHTEAGLKTYRVVIEADDDTIIANNEYSSYTMAEAASMVLVVEGNPGQAAEFEKVLRAGNINYQLVSPLGVPDKINQMLEYQSMILVDVYKDDLKAGFLDGLEAYVRDFGGGVIAIGGENSFALGNYRNSPLEEVLPVYMDLKGEKEIPPMAFLLIIDKSGSMSDGNGHVTNLSLAKEAAIKAVENLRPIDTVGVISFDDSYSWTNPLIKNADFEEVKKQIRSITIGGGTSIYPAVEVGVLALAEADAPLKHIVLLTDGQDGYRDYDDLLAVIEAQGITFSTVSVGSDADTRLLEDLAGRGNGRYYHTDLNTDIPRIFAQEVYLSVQSYLVQREFYPQMVSNHEILNQIDASSVPPLSGYIAATKKEFAQGILVSDTGDPILTSWQYGLGRTVAFNSDVENKWTAAYSNWDEYVMFWKNIIDYTLFEVDAEGISATVRKEGSEGIITFQSETFDGETTAFAVVTDEDGNSEDVLMNPIAPGVYEGKFSTGDASVYSLNIRQEKNGEVVKSLNTAYATQYSKEYRFMEAGADLQGFLTRVGGEFVNEAAGLLENPPIRVKSQQSLTNWLLLIAVLVFVGDIAMRRLRFDDILLVRWQQVKVKNEEHKKLKKAIKATTPKQQLEQSPEPPPISEVLLSKDTKGKVKKPKMKKPNHQEIKSESGLDMNALLQKKKERDEQLKK